MELKFFLWLFVCSCYSMKVTLFTFTALLTDARRWSQTARPCMRVLGCMKTIPIILLYVLVPRQLGKVYSCKLITNIWSGMKFTNWCKSNISSRIIWCPNLVCKCKIIDIYKTKWKWDQVAPKYDSRYRNTNRWTTRRKGKTQRPVVINGKQRRRWISVTGLVTYPWKLGNLFP